MRLDRLLPLLLFAALIGYREGCHPSPVPPAPSPSPFPPPIPAPTPAPDPGPPPPPRPSPTPNPQPPAPTPEASALDTLNAGRARAGLAPFTLDARLARAAQVHSDDMAAGRQPMGHAGFPDRLYAAGFPRTSRVSEGVFPLANGADLAYWVHWLVANPREAHGRDFADPGYGAVGIGIANGSSGGYSGYITIDYGTTTTTGAGQSAPPTAAPEARPVVTQAPTYQVPIYQVPIYQVPAYDFRRPTYGRLPTFGGCANGRCRVR